MTTFTLENKEDKITITPELRQLLIKANYYDGLKSIWADEAKKKVADYVMSMVDDNGRVYD